ncbi:MAG: GxxExxY protein [Cytophagaceae bacterium]
MTLIHSDLTKKILECAYKIHSSFGPGLLESAYEEVLYYEIKKSGLSVKKQHPLPLVYEEVYLDAGYRLDLWVENKVVLEIKAVDALNDVHFAQLMTYLKLSESKVGFLINFNVKSLKEGIRRVVM